LKAPLSHLRYGNFGQLGASGTANIQGTFREHSGNIQGILKAPLSHLRYGNFGQLGASGTTNIQGTFSEHSGNIQRILKAPLSHLRYGNFGQLGASGTANVGATPSSMPPVSVRTIEAGNAASVLALAAGGMHTCARFDTSLLQLQDAVYPEYIRILVESRAYP
jgi:hypothetical protein